MAIAKDQIEQRYAAGICPLYVCRIKIARDLGFCDKKTPGLKD